MSRSDNPSHRSYWIATDDQGRAIHGIGLSPQEAIEDARDQSRDRERDYLTIPCSNTLYDRVINSGGAIALGEDWALVDPDDMAEVGGDLVNGDPRLNPDLTRCLAVTMGEVDHG